MLVIVLMENFTFTVILFCTVGNRLASRNKFSFNYIVSFLYFVESNNLPSLIKDCWRGF